MTKSLSPAAPSLLPETFLATDDGASWKSVAERAGAWAAWRLLACCVAVWTLAAGSVEARAEQEGRVQILLLGDSTTEGSIPRLLQPAGPHLETVIQQLLVAEGDLPPCDVINSSLSGEYIQRLLDSGRYDRDIAQLPGLDYILIRYGLNDQARVENFPTQFPLHFQQLLARLRKDHPAAQLIPMTVIPFASEAASAEINALIRQVAEAEQLPVFDIYPRYAEELKRGPNMLNYRRYPLNRIPEKYHALVQPWLKSAGVIVMDNELDAILGHLPGWYGDRHPNLAGYNVIAHETVRYLAPVIKTNAQKIAQQDTPVVIPLPQNAPNDAAPASPPTQDPRLAEQQLNPGPP